MPPSSLSRSKAWVGWPMPRRTKLLASTALRDLFLAEEGEVFGDLAGAGCDGDVAEDLGGEAAAECFGFDGDGEGLRRGGLWRFGRNTGVPSTALRMTTLFLAFREWCEGEVVDGGGFAGDAVVVHGVDAVGGDVHLEEVARWFTRGEGLREWTPSTAMPRRVRSSANCRSETGRVGR